MKKGFTLIELLVTIAIVGILAAQAIPLYNQYRVRAFNSAAQSDLRNLKTGQEAYFIDFKTYSTTVSAIPGFKSTTDVTVLLDGVVDTGWNAGTAHLKGDTSFCSYNQIGDTSSNFTVPGLGACVGAFP